MIALIDLRGLTWTKDVRQGVCHAEVIDPIRYQEAESW